MSVATMNHPRRIAEHLTRLAGLRWRTPLGHGTLSAIAAMADQESPGNDALAMIFRHDDPKHGSCCVTLSIDSNAAHSAQEVMRQINAVASPLKLTEG